MNIFVCLIRICIRLVGLSGLEPPTSRLSGARSNLLSYKPIFSGVLPVSIFDQIAIFNSRSELRLRADVVRWWRWWDSNPWPPACRAGALPTELHPHWCVCSLFFQRSEEFDNPSKLNNKRRCTRISSSLVNDSTLELRNILLDTTGSP